jgi:predicted transposase YbfD/YdcC
VEKKTQKTTDPETVAQISSLVDPSSASFLDISRNHWFIENGLHNILDGTYQEDRQKMHTGNGPLNITLLRAFAISCKNLLGQPSMPDAQSYFQSVSHTILRRLHSAQRLAG